LGGGGGEVRKEKEGTRGGGWGGGGGELRVDILLFFVLSTPEEANSAINLTSNL